MVESSTAPPTASPRLATDKELPALVNGHPVADKDLVISALDPGLLRGDGVFEVIRVYDGVALAASEHLDRLYRSAHALALEYDARALEEECVALCADLGAVDTYVRVVVTRLGVRLLLAEPTVPFPEVMRLHPVSHAVSPLLAGVKALSYAANCQAHRMAVARGYDDALLIDPDSRVLELPFASFGCVIDGRMVVPPLDLGVLDSITRRILMECFDVEIRAFSLGQLSAATEACVIGTGMEVTPVAEVSGIGSFDPHGPVLGAATKAVRARIGERLARERRFRGQRRQQHTATTSGGYA